MALFPVKNGPQYRSENQYRAIYCHVCTLPEDWLGLWLYKPYRGRWMATKSSSKWFRKHLLRHNPIYYFQCTAHCTELKGYSDYKTWEWNFAHVCVYLVVKRVLNEKFILGRKSWTKEAQEKKTVSYFLRSSFCTTSSISSLSWVRLSLVSREINGTFARESCFFTALFLYNNSSRAKGAEAAAKGHNEWITATVTTSGKWSAENMGPPLEIPDQTQIEKASINFYPKFTDRKR